jgi:hypothetical protein
MYKRQSPEALHLATLGRADSKRPETTCRGITTAGKACRKALRKGSRDKYCHLHVDQETTYRSRLMRGKLTTVKIVEEEEEEEEETVTPRVAKTEVKNGYVTPAASPKRLSPVRKPVPSSTMYTTTAGLRPPSLQFSPGPSIAPPTPPHSIHSPTPMSDPDEPPKEKKKVFKLGKAFRKLFIHDSPKPTSTPAHPSHGPSVLPVDFRRNDLYPSRYPPGISPSPPRPTAPPSPPMHAPIPPFHKRQMPVQFPPKPKVKAPQIQGRPSTAVLACAQSRSATTGIQRSWETMWVPGSNGEGAHIICKGSPPPPDQS